MESRVRITRELRVNAGDTLSAARFMAISRDKELQAEQYRGFQLLSCSRTFYAKVGLKMHVLIDCEAHEMQFPTSVARYHQARDDELSAITDARLITKANVMIKREQLPSFHKMQETGDAWLTRNASHIVNDANIVSTEARAFVSKVVTEGQSCTVLLEAQLSNPVSFCDTTRFQFVVRETRGAPFDASTITLTGKELTSAMNTIFKERRRALAQIQKQLERVGPDGEVQVAPNQLLTAGNTFQFDLDATDPQPTEATLNRVCFCWRDRRLALISVTLAVGFVLAPDPVAIIDSCPTCFDEIADASSAWRCSQCKKHIHQKCMDDWKNTCHHNGWPSNCPLCRAAQ